MNLRLLAMLLAAITLLLSTLGCSKKEETASPSTNASYAIDGQIRQAQATQIFYTNSGYDNLVVSLTTTPEPSNGPEILYVVFWKPTGQPNTAYVFRPVAGIVLNQGTAIPINVQPATASATFTSNGGISGTFSGEVHGLNGSGSLLNYLVTAGTFTDARP